MKWVHTLKAALNGLRKHGNEFHAKSQEPVLKDEAQTLAGEPHRIPPSQLTRMSSDFESSSKTATDED